MTNEIELVDGIASVLKAYGYETMQYGMAWLDDKQGVISETKDNPLQYVAVGITDTYQGAYVRRMGDTYFQKAGIGACNTVVKAFVDCRLVCWTGNIKKHRSNDFFWALGQAAKALERRFTIDVKRVMDNIEKLLADEYPETDGPISAPSVYVKAIDFTASFFISACDAEQNDCK